MDNEYQIRIINNIAEADRGSWNKISSNFYSSYEWVKSLEESKVFNTDRYYILIYRQDQLISFAITFVQAKEYFANISEVFLGKHWKYFPYKINPCLLCYSPLSAIGPGIEIAKEEKNNSEILLDLISKEMGKICQQKKIAYFGFLNIPKGSSLNNYLQKKYHRAFTCYNTYLPVKWSDFEDYITSFKAKRRYNVRREIKAYQAENFASGITTDFNIDEYVELINSSERVNDDKIYRLPLGFYRSLKRNKGEKMFAAYARRHDKLVLAALFFEYKNNLYAFKNGHNNQTEKNSFGLFVLSMYKIIEFAINHRLEKIIFGTGTYKYKIYRQAQLEPLYLYLRSDQKIKNFILKYFFSLAGWWKKNKHDKIINK